MFVEHAVYNNKALAIILILCRFDEDTYKILYLFMET